MKVVFRSAKATFDATFAGRKAALICCTLLGARASCRVLGMWFVVLSIVALSSLSLTSEADAQVGGRLPPFSYYQGFDDFYRADYRSALRRFTTSATTAYKFGDQRFLDSVCAWTMMGECHFHLGNYTEALVLYERSLDLYLQYTKLKWQDRLQLPQLIQPDDVQVDRARVTWYRPQRKVKIARLPSEMSMLFGRLDAIRALQEGGVFNPAELRQVDVTEIMRCTALAAHRRRVIRGPLCKYDPFSTTLVNGLRATITNTSTVVGAYNGVLKGIAAASLEDWSNATARLKKSVQFANQYDHALSPVAFLTLADIGLATGGDDIAGKLALEASYLAAIYNQYDILEESLSKATMIHLKNSRTVFAPLENAIIWSNRRANWLQAMLQVRLAECLVESGNGTDAARVLRQAAKAVKRESIPKTVIANRYQYLLAATSFLNGDLESGQVSLDAGLNPSGNGSLSRFRMQLVNTLSATGAIGERQSDQLFEILLKDPTKDEWLLDPFEAMSALMFSRVDALERWFEIAISRKNYTRAINVSEHLRRYRFYANLPLAGRLLSFRWMLNGASQAVTKETLARRSQFFVQHPGYQDLVRRADQVHADADGLPVVPEPKSDELRKLAKLLPQLIEISALQEAYLAKVALLREPVEMEFPPQRDAEKWLKSIQPGQRAMIGVATANAYYSLMATDQGFQYLGRVSRRKLKPMVNAYIKSLQVADNVLEPEKLAEGKWQKPARKFMEAIWPGVNAAEWTDVKELVIVPDGWLWYTPVELFPVGVQEKDPPMLGDQFAIRYSPTLYTSFGAQRPPVKTGVNKRAIVLAGKMSPRGKADAVVAQITELQKQHSDVKQLKQLTVESGVYSSLVSQWLVWGGLNIDRSSPLSFVPIPAGLAQGQQPSLTSWVAYPWRGPQSVLMPGFQSDAGVGLKNQLEGSDLFLTTCGLMAAGTDEILVSRWNTGGDIGLKIGREYLQQRTALPVNQALSEAKKFGQQQDLTEVSEPKLRLPRGTDKTVAKYPVFWSSMIVVQVPAEKPPAATGQAVPASQTTPPGPIGGMGVPPAMTTKQSVAGKGPADGKPADNAAPDAKVDDDDTEGKAAEMTSTPDAADVQPGSSDEAKEPTE